MSATGLALLLAFAPPPACVREATELLARGEAEAAAVRGEACFADEGHAQGLLLASQAWLQAGRLAYARVDADRFLALKTGAKPARRVAELVRETATGRAGTMRLAVSPAVSPGEPVSLTATQPGRPGEPLRVRWDEVAGGAGEASLALDPGAWELTIARPGYELRRIELTCAEGQVTTIAVDLTPEDGGPPPEVLARRADEARRRRGWGIAGAAIGGPAIVGGAVMLGIGLPAFGAVFNGMSCGTGASVDGCRRPLAGLAERTAGGAALLGAGAGALVGGLSGLVGAESARHKLWTAEAIAGGVLTGGGVALLAYGSAYFSTANTREPWPQADVGRGGQLYVLGAGLLGGGLGLAATAATGLIVELVQRRTGRRSARVSGGALRF